MVHAGGTTKQLASAITQRAYIRMSTFWTGVHRVTDGKAGQNMRRRKRERKINITDSAQESPAFRYGECQKGTCVKYAQKSSQEVYKDSVRIIYSTIGDSRNSQGHGKHL